MTAWVLGGSERRVAGRRSRPRLGLAPARRADGPFAVFLGAVVMSLSAARLARAGYAGGGGLRRGRVPPADARRDGLGADRHWIRRLAEWLLAHDPREVRDRHRVRARAAAIGERPRSAGLRRAVSPVAPCSWSPRSTPRSTSVARGRARHGILGSAESAGAAAGVSGRAFSRSASCVRASRPGIACRACGARYVDLDGLVRQAGRLARKGDAVAHTTATRRRQRGSVEFAGTRASCRSAVPLTLDRPDT